MTNFEKITETPEALGEFLASLPVADGPWDAEFHKAFCADCERENCDGKRCLHNAERGNPVWWLNLGRKPGEVPGLSIRVRAAFPIMWGREYYTVAGKQKETRAPCVCCDNTGKCRPSAACKGIAPSGWLRRPFLARLHGLIVGHISLFQRFRFRGYPQANSVVVNVHPL